MRAIGHSSYDRSDLVGFTRVMAGFFALLGCVAAWRADFTTTPAVGGFAAAGAAWLLWGLLHPQSTRPLYRGWMWTAFRMNYLVSRVVLGVLFFGVLLPTSLLVRLARKDLLGLSEEAGSYWKQREPPSKRSHFEKLF